MTPTEEVANLTDEIARLKGELSAATKVIAIALHIICQGDTDILTTIIQEKMASALSVGPTIGENEWREGVERFKNRLSESIPSHIS